MDPDSITQVKKKEKKFADLFQQFVLQVFLDCIYRIIFYL